MKRSVLIIFAIILFSNIASADYISLNISNIAASGQKFNGFTEIELDKPISNNANLVFSIDGNKIIEKLINYVDSTKYKIFPETYKKKSATPQVSKEIVFSSPESKIEVGIDLSSGNTRKEDNIDEILEFNFKVRGEGNPSVNIDIGNDNKIDYVYRDLTRILNWEDLDYLYLKDNNVDEWTEIKSNSQDVFCQEVKLKPSDKYDINIKARKKSSDATIKATILDEPGSFECGTEEFQTSCCSLTGRGEDLNCGITKISKQINEEGIFYACVSIPEVLDSTKVYYEIAGISNTESTGYYNGDEAGINYFIKVKRALYNERLNGLTSAVFEKEKLQEYLDNCKENCLLIPINITSEYPGKITLQSLLLKIITNRGTTTLNNFVGINFEPTKVNYTEKIKIDLSNLKNLIVPDEKENYKIYAELLDLKSNEIEFDSVKGPKAVIGISNVNPGIGETVILNAGRSKAENNKSIVKYKWNIGNDSKNSSEVTYIFLKKGTVDIVLVVTDSNGVIGQEKITINVGPTSGSIYDEINNALDVIRKSRVLFSSGDTQLKDTASLLMIDLDKTEANIIGLNKTIEAVIKSDKPEDKKIDELTKLSKQLNDLINKTPVNLVVNVFTFPATIINVEDIPQKIGTTEELKNSIFIAQEKVSVIGEARVVSVKYNNELQEEFIIVKKNIDSGSGDVYEILPHSFEKKEILTDGYTLIADNIIKFSDISSFTYLANGDLKSALNTKTIVVPKDLKVEVNADEREVQYSIKLGSNKERIIISISALGIILLIIYFGMFFRGGLFKKQSKESLFRNPNDYYNLVHYVNNSLKKGIKKDKIRIALRKKGWNDKQIDSIMK